MGVLVPVIVFIARVGYARLGCLLGKECGVFELLNNWVLLFCQSISEPSNMLLSYKFSFSF